MSAARGNREWPHPQPNGGHWRVPFGDRWVLRYAFRPTASYGVRCSCRGEVTAAIRSVATGPWHAQPSSRL